MRVLRQLKREVERSYGFDIKKWDVIKKLKKSSLVVRIVAKNGKRYALKTLYISPKRQQFIVESEQALAQRGIKLAIPAPTSKGSLYFLHKKTPYVLYEWIEGKSAKLGSLDDLNKIVKAMAQFHQASNELNYSPNVQIYGHPHWEKEYEERIETLEKWSKRKMGSKGKTAAIVDKYVPYFRKMAKKALKKLKKSGYQDYINRPNFSKTLVHGDLHHNNLISKKGTKGTLYLIDFEDVRYDLPSKELLRIYSMYTKKHRFDQAEFESMMDTYSSTYSLTPDVKQIVMIDLLFPHIFERLIRKKKYVGMEPKELKHRIKQEKAKVNYIYQKYFKQTNNNRGGDRID